MDTSIGGILIISVLLASVLLLSRATNVSDLTRGAAIKEANRLAGERARTDLNFVQFTNITSKVDIDVKNVGNTSISSFAQIDYIILYTKTEDGGTLAVERMEYVPGSSANGTWDVIPAISPDTFQPGIWDPGETMPLSGNVSGVPLSGTAVDVWVSTPNGSRGSRERYGPVVACPRGPSKSEVPPVCPLPANITTIQGRHPSSPTA